MWNIQPVVVKEKLSHEIKIAVIGPVSAGKSTLINGLLAGKYSEVSMQRTTAGINYFRLNPVPQENGNLTTPNTDTDLQSSTLINQEDEIRLEISEDNKRLRGDHDDNDEVQRKTFDINGVELCECRDDTKLVLVDIPGINEAGSKSKYHDFIKAEWNDFDCAILVLDGRHGVNTEEQVNMLKFVKSNLRTKRNIPVLILFNKVDELGFTEKEAILKEAEQKVASLFNIPSAPDLASEIVENKLGEDLQELINAEGYYMPVFLPFSARDGYVYRLAAKADAERFKMLEMHLVENLGKQQIGLRRWHKLSKDKKYEAAFEAISDPEVRKEGLESSNFAALSLILSFCVGKQSQRTLIVAQIERDLSQLSADKDLVQGIGNVWGKMKAVSIEDTMSPPVSLQVSFWEKFDELEGRSMTLKKAPTALHVLIQYQMFLRSTFFNVEEEVARTIESAVTFLNKLMHKVLAVWRKGDLVTHIFRLGQILSVSHNPYFGDCLCTLKTILAFEYHKMITQLTAQESRGEGEIGFIFESGEWKVQKTVLNSKVTSLESANDRPPCNDANCGHTFWLFCEWVRHMDQSLDPGFKKYKAVLSGKNKTE